jgi:hypothetical protein
VSAASAKSLMTNNPPVHCNDKRRPFRHHHPSFILADNPPSSSLSTRLITRRSSFTPAAEPDPQKRTLLVLKRLLSSLKSQQYAWVGEGWRYEALNTFLDELFLGAGRMGVGATSLISEQVGELSWRTQLLPTSGGYDIVEL